MGTDIGFGHDKHNEEPLNNPHFFALSIAMQSEPIISPIALSHPVAPDNPSRRGVFIRLLLSNHAIISCGMRGRVLVSKQPLHRE
jgi:hypothetical protein